MKKIVVLCAVLTLIVMSALAASPAAQGPRTVPRYVSGELDGRFDFTRTWGSEWWEFYTDGDVKGTLNHLGLSRMYTTHIPDVFTGELTDGTFTIVAANGDKIEGTYDGFAEYISADQALGEATFLISGGTGRFAGATGILTATFLETFDDPSWASAKVSWTLAGTVNY